MSGGAEVNCEKGFSTVTEVIQCLLECGANVLSEDNKGYTPLHYAIERNDLCAIKALVASGLDLNSVTSRVNGTILNFAVTVAKVCTIELLLDLGADVLKADGYGRSCTHAAGGKGDVPMLEFLFTQGASVEKDLRGITGLHLAAWRGHEDAVKWFLDHGVSPDLRDSEGWTPLHYAAEWDQVPSAKVLLERSASVNALDHGFHTPLYWANYCGHRRLSELLTQWGGKESPFT